jgi:hypothetical protein
VEEGGQMMYSREDVKNLLQSIVCRFKDHVLVSAGSCPYTGRTYQLCTRCTAMIPVEELA